MRTLALYLSVSTIGASSWSAADATPHVKGHQPQSHQVTTGCSLPAGWDKVEALKPRFVVFGEMHGTQQAPAFVGALACALASQGERVLVAVEHSSSEDQAFQQAWQLPHPKFAPALKQAGWKNRQDGVGSEAMFDLIVRLHRLASEGRSIKIVAFNGAKDEEQSKRFSQLTGQGPHEAAQAENIRIAAKQDYDHVLVLVGNIHAQKRIVERPDFTFEPMVMHLGDPKTIVTLNMATAGGTAWNCQTRPGLLPKNIKPIASLIVCGSYPLRSDADLNHTPFIALPALPGTGADPAYDGVFWLGPVNASAPVVPQRN
jgi:hypothetical protein